MQVNAYLNFNGQCAEAFRFYEQVLGGKIEAMMTHGETPMSEHVGPEWRDAIIHARLVVGDQVLLGSDAPPEYFEKPQGFSVSISLPSPDEAQRIFNGLAENGTVTMPFGKTFWSPAFGMTVDRFGIPWMVNCEAAAATT